MWFSRNRRRRKKEQQKTARNSAAVSDKSDEVIDETLSAQEPELGPDPRAAEIVARFQHVNNDGNQSGIPLWAFTSAIDRADDLLLHMGTCSVLWQNEEFVYGASSGWPGVLFAIGDGSGSSIGMSEVLATMSRQSYITCANEAMKRCSPAEQVAIRRVAYMRIWEQRQSGGPPIDQAKYETAEELLRDRLHIAGTSFDSGEWEPTRATKDNFADLAIRHWVEELAPQVLSEQQQQALALAHARLHPASAEPTVVDEAWLRLHTGGYERLLRLADQIDLILGR